MITVLFYSNRNRKLYSKRDELTEILVINTGHIGEMVLTTAFLANLRDVFPNARITLMGGSWAVGVIENSTLVDRTIVYNSNVRSRERKKGLSFLELLRFICNLRKAKFDLIIDLRSDYWVMLYSIICNAKFRIDFGTNRLRKYFKKSAMRPKKIEHYCLRYLNVLDEIGPLTKKTKLYLETEPEADKWVENKLAELGIYSQDFIVIFHPFAEWWGREWAVHKFAEVADYCSSHYNAKIIITGKKEDKDRAAQMVGLITTQAYNLVGQTTLTELVALISRADIFVCNDGGPMHIAAALGIPSVSLFGPQTPLIFGPWSESNEVIYHKKDCSPCVQRYCRKKPNCMELIEVEEVIRATDKLCKKARELSQIPSKLVI